MPVSLLRPLMSLSKFLFLLTLLQLLFPYPILQSLFISQLLQALPLQSLIHYFNPLPSLLIRRLHPQKFAPTLSSSLPRSFLIPLE